MSYLRTPDKFIMADAHELIHRATDHIFCDDDRA
jgi:hypothetical protein